MPQTLGKLVELWSYLIQKVIWDVYDKRTSAMMAPGQIDTFASSTKQGDHIISKDRDGCIDH